MTGPTQAIFPFVNGYLGCKLPEERQVILRTLCGPAWQAGRELGTALIIDPLPWLDASTFFLLSF